MFGNLQVAMKKIGVSLGVLAFAGSYSYAQQWENVGGVATVSAGGSSYNNLVIDNAGKYYLSYYDTSVAKGSVQIFNGNTWSYAGGSAGITTGTALYNSLSVDGLGNIFYTNQIGYPGSGMEVRRFNGTSWNSLPNATTTSVNYHASAVSPSNVLFTFGSHNSGTVSRFVNGAWEQVGNAGFSNGAMYAEMVIGTNNKVYTANVSGGLRVYVNSTTASATDNWELVGGSIVDGAAASELYTSDIAIDGNNNVYVAYVSNSSNGTKLNVKKFDGTSWVAVGNQYFSEGRVQHVAIAVTSSGEPYVVGSRFENDNYLKNSVFKLNANQVWEKFGGDFISDGQATYNDLAIDKANNYLVLAYSDTGTKVKRISLEGSNAIPTCNNTDPGTNPGDLGCVSFFYQGQQIVYTTVRGADGKVWFQQNLGSSRVATAFNDAESYGDLFQWGRWDDGHQLRNSPTDSAPDPNSPMGITGGNNSFIIGPSGSSWWGTHASSDAWTAASSSDVTTAIGADPCKKVGQGWRLPVSAEWVSAVNAEGINNPATAYSSYLKLPASGYRSSSTGGFSFVGERGYFWSSETAVSGGKYLYVGTGNAQPTSGAPRGQGEAIRCIKDFTQLGTVDVKLNAATAGVYPNPTNGILNIKADSTIDTVAVYNLVGQKVDVQISNNQIDMKALSNGVYIVELKLKNGQKISKKVVKN
ncbi:T9SS type A sorting domain-containing protein [Chryseobacterium sp. MYb264]|uniref:T9SS type A sorting domain-containing protein n=1 Tax=Chryseobacterium sp. MYb264 TaxID=2745153 RepID=UPI002E1364EA|nr:T9SS type A sorting domain-containing protein [Chryseobacterium sp. MYb264]